eukprot:s2312_g5.t1
MGQRGVVQEHHGGANSDARAVRPDGLGPFGALRAVGMALRIAELLHLPDIPLLLRPGQHNPAETQERGRGGDGKHGQSEGDRIHFNTDYLVHTSKFFNEVGQTFNSGANSSLLIPQKAVRFERPNQGHGHQSAPNTGGHGVSKSSLPAERGVIKTLGRSLGNSFRVIKDKLKVKKQNSKWKKTLGKATSRLTNLGGSAQDLVGDKLTGMKRACQVARSSQEFESALNSLKGNFWAASSRASRDVKRGEVLRLASLVASGEVDIFPLSQKMVEGVAACLKAADMKSGDQYLNELKLLHVEEGYDLPPWLVRTFSLCKKALTRNKGPVRRAIEAKVEDISEDFWQLPGEQFENGINSALIYAWAMIWMLREIEASECKWEHVQADGQTRKIALSIPISKMDQGGRGVKRTLQCCGEVPCSRFCAWRIWERITDEFPNRKHNKNLIFTDKSKNKLSKKSMVDLWKSATEKPVTGHSARRSGAMEHVRRGLQIQELAFLGRWRSAVVLTYANDALQEVPANRGGGTNISLATSVGTTAPWTPRPQPMAPCTPVPCTPAPASHHVQDEGEGPSLTELVKPRAQKLWVASADGRRGKKTWHQVTNAGWQIPMASWNTACGWNFTRNPEKVLLSASLLFNQAQCKKCCEVRKTRDRVMEGRSLAGFLQTEADPTIDI